MTNKKIIYIWPYNLPSNVLFKILKVEMILFYIIFKYSVIKDQLYTTSTFCVKSYNCPWPLFLCI